MTISNRGCACVAADPHQSLQRSQKNPLHAHSCKRNPNLPVRPHRGLQPFSQKSRTATVPKVFQIGLCGVVEADLELFWDSWSVGFLGERLYWELFGNSWSEGFLENSCNNGLLGRQSGQPSVRQFIRKNTACRQIRGDGSTNRLASSVWSLGTQRWGRKHNLSCKLHDAATCTQARLGAGASGPPGSGTSP